MESVSDLEDWREITLWWRFRKRIMATEMAPRRRVTYHVAPQWIEAIRQEASTTGDTQGDVLERALALYFYGKGDAYDPRSDHAVSPGPTDEPATGPRRGDS